MKPQPHYLWNRREVVTYYIITHYETCGPVLQQEPRNNWQYPHPAHIPPHGNQFGINHQFINPGHRQPPRPLERTDNHYSCNTYLNQHNPQSTQWRGRGRGQGRGRGRGRGRRGHSGGRSGGWQSYPGR